MKKDKKTPWIAKVLIAIMIVVGGFMFSLVASTDFPFLDYRMLTRDNLFSFYRQCNKIQPGDSFENINKLFIELGAIGDKSKNENENKGLIAYYLPNTSADVCFVGYKMKNDIYLTVESTAYSPD